ncbi:hypothetical protein FHG89_32620 [Micromonospora orduensis]|uniref:Uncharacterized protein n=1 Tax=Micromonospora orduensis TaxID=1420891 RepID=A0A5C4Q7L4_9ACTN|nr:hypothetical protein [Micromonospora orduensis]TNH21006.1 hypothetical protein FHG89_32620 [Micromonospora orduensis]
MYPDDPTQRQQPPVPPQPGSSPPPPQSGPQYPPPQAAHGQYPPQGYPPPTGFQQTTVASGGIPGWMHVLYAVGGIFTCGVLWVVWIVHWWFAQSKSRSTTTVTAVPPQPPHQYPPQ